jgi:cytidylate kinase
MGEATASLEEDTASQGKRGAPRVIAVDGSAASGKSTIGRRLAEVLGYPFLDTGIMYRAITWAALQGGIRLDDDERMSCLANSVRMDVRLAPPGSEDGTRVLIDGEDVTGKLRLPEVEDGVSVASGVAGVREALVRLQREIAGKQPVVMAGRDIGTVVLPDADLKVYLDASLRERARRRYEEFAALDREVTEEMVQEDLRRRDRLDSQRAVSPLRPAEDAVVIDTYGLDQDEVLQRVLELAGISR